VKNIVFWNHTARGERTSGACYIFGKSAKFDLSIKKTVASGAVVGRFPWKGQSHGLSSLSELLDSNDLGTTLTADGEMRAVTDESNEPRRAL